jgi:VWFA-related protein
MHPGKPSLIATSALLLSMTAFAQPPAPETSAAPTIKVFTRETIVDVVVTDSKGNPVRGLQQSDFAIDEDGKPQPIRSFGEFERGFATQPNAYADAAIRSNAHAAPSTGPVNILLIDALHANFVSASRSLRAVSAYAARMPAGTQLAVYWLGVSGLHLLQNFTTDRAEIQQAVAVTRTDIGSNLDCYQTDKLTINALNQIAAYVADIKGRKNLIWMSDGVPLYLMRDGGIAWGRATACNDNALEPTPLGVSRGGGASLFTGPDGVETPGLDMTEVHSLMDTYETFSTEQIAVSPFDLRGVYPGNLGQDQLVAEDVAEQSGGFAIYNSNDLTGSLSQAIDNGSHYYTVSYVPPRRKDDSHYHTITIHVDHPGLKLTYRRGYNAEQPRAPREYSGPDLIKAALQGRVPAATQLIFQARLVPSVPQPIALVSRSQAPPAPPPDSETVDAFADEAPPKPAPPVAAPPVAPPAVNPPTRGNAKGKQPAVRQPYDLLLALQQDQITYGSAPGGGHTVKLQFAFDAYDLNGKLLGARAQNVDLTLTPEKYATFIKSPVVFYQRIDFFPGPLFLRIGIMDSTSNKVGTIEIPVTIPKK